MVFFGLLLFVAIFVNFEPYQNKQISHNINFLFTHKPSVSPHVKNGETPKFSSSNDNDSNISSSEGAMGTGRAAASWYSDYYVPRGQKCREISKSLAGLQGFQSMFGGMSFSENINSRYKHYKSEYAKNQCDTVI